MISLQLNVFLCFLSPWKYFKESCEQSYYKRELRSSRSSYISPLPVSSRLKTRTKLNKKEHDLTIKEEDESFLDKNANNTKNDLNQYVAPVYMDKSFHESDVEKNRREKDFSSDDDEIKQIKSSSEDEEIRKNNLNQKTSYISSKKFKNELKAIRV